MNENENQKRIVEQNAIQKGIEGNNMEESKSIAEKAVASLLGLLDQESINKAIEEKANQIIEKTYRDLIEKIIPVPISIIDKNMVEITRINEVVSSKFEEILKLAQGRINVLMVGPSGCGKTHLAEQIAKALNLRFDSISITSGISESQLSGWLLPTGDNGQFKYVQSPLVDFYENGGVYLLDEIDSADANTLTFINSAISNGRFTIPNRSENPIAKRHKDFILIAAANTYGNGADRMYVGRNQLDAATLDRFKVGTITMDYDDKIEEKIVDKSILSWGKKIREHINRLGLKKILSTRFLKDLTTMRSIDPERYSQGSKWFEKLTEGWSKDEIEKILKSVNDGLGSKSKNKLIKQTGGEEVGIDFSKITASGGLRIPGVF